MQPTRVPQNPVSPPTDTRSLVAALAMTLALPALLWAAANPLLALALSSVTLAWRRRGRLAGWLAGRRVRVSLASVTVTVAVDGE